MKLDNLPILAFAQRALDRFHFMEHQGPIMPEERADIFKIMARQAVQLDRWNKAFDEGQAKEKAHYERMGIPWPLNIR